MRLIDNAKNEIIATFVLQKAHGRPFINANLMDSYVSPLLLVMIFFPFTEIINSIELVMRKVFKQMRRKEKICRMFTCNQCVRFKIVCVHFLMKMLDVGQFIFVAVWRRMVIVMCLVRVTNLIFSQWDNSRRHCDQV